jgi:bacteriocin biosynthesis cyclodehydratase domain-containing protein
VSRPTLLPGLRRLWRGRYRLQLGLDPAHAVVLELPDPAIARVLDLLDGTRPERAVLAEAARRGIAEPTARDLLDRLYTAGLVVGAHTLMPHNLPDAVRRRLSAEAAALALRGHDAPATPAQTLRRRRGARVVVTGQGRLAAPVALALAHAGVGRVTPALTGRVTPGDPLLPPGRPLGAAVADAITATAPGTETAAVRRTEATFVVHVGPVGPGAVAVAGYAQRRMPHLVAGVRDGTAVIGPLVPPAGRPCLNCQELHRQDRDPDWAHLSAQLVTGPAPATDACAAATVLSAAGFAAGEVLAWLDGRRPTTLGASVEIAAPGELRRRSWPPHPHCPCTRTRRRH